MKTWLPLLLGTVLLGMASCQQRMYFPERANSPGLREGGEAKLTLSLKPQSSSDIDSVQRGNPVSFAADLAFAPVNHLLVFGSYRSLNHRVIREDNGDYDVFGGDFSGHRWEGGLGYFTTFGRLGKFEVLAGYGQGKIRRYSNNSPQKDYSAAYGRVFIQPAVGAGNQKYSVTGGIRFAYQRFYDFTSRDPDLRYEIMRNTYSRDVTQEDISFIEPFINAEVGWKYLKYNMQVGFGGQVMGGNISGGLPFYLSMGLVFNIAPGYIRGEDNTRKKPRD